MYKSIPLPEEGVHVPTPPQCTEEAHLRALAAAEGEGDVARVATSSNLLFLVSLQILLIMTFVWLQVPKTQSWLSASWSPSRLGGLRRAL